MLPHSLSDDAENQPLLSEESSPIATSTDNNGYWEVNPNRSFGANIPPEWLGNPVMHSLLRLIGFALCLIILLLQLQTGTGTPWIWMVLFSGNVLALIAFVHFSHVPAKSTPPAVLTELQKRAQRKILMHLSIKRVEGLIPSPEAEASLLSILTFSWFDPVMFYGYSNQLELSDVWNLHRTEQMKINMNNYYHLKTLHANIPLINAIGSLNISTMLIQFSLTLVSTVLFFAGPFFLNLIIKSLENPTSSPPGAAYLYVLGILVATVMRITINAQVTLLDSKISMRVESLLAGLIYRKSLRRAPSLALAEDSSNHTAGASIGKIVNLMSADARKVGDWTGEFFTPLITATQIILCVAALVLLLGWSALTGVVFMILLILGGGPLANFVSKQFDAMSIQSDRRGNAMNELLHGIRVIKLFAWENQFEAKIDKLREKDLAQQFITFMSTASTAILWQSAPIITTLVTFASYTKIAGNDLDAATAFTALALFGLLRGPLQQFPDHVVAILDSWVSFTRVRNFLAEEELEDFTNPSMNTANGKLNPSLGFNSANFEWKNAERNTGSKDIKAPTSNSWSSFLSFGKSTLGYQPIATESTAAANELPSPDDSVFRLYDLNIEFMSGQLNVIIGATASGKSSLLLALLGEMRRIQGTRSCSTTRNIGVAYVSQSAWLTNATIRENILFGSPYDPARYKKVIEACALEKDLETLDGGDQTEIGEKGINLSGGQKQRIALARAAYSVSPYVIMDDPLSAVDAPTARHLYDHCILGLLGNRTRILVTNAVGLTVPRADFLVVIQNGRVGTQGTVEGVFHDLKSGVISGPFVEGISDMTDMILTDRRKYFDSHGHRRIPLSNTEPLPDTIVPVANRVEVANDFGRVNNANAAVTHEELAKKAKSKLVEKENMEKGGVDPKVYWFYIAAAGGIPYILLVLFGFSLQQVFNILQNIVIQQWTQSYKTNNAFSVPSLNSWTSPAVNLFQFSSNSGGVSPSSIAAFTFDESPQDREQNNSSFYLTMYALVGLGSLFAGVFRFGTFLMVRIRAARNIHRRLVHRMLRAPLRYFEVTPIGRILNRFTSDLGGIDMFIGLAGGNWLFNVTAIVFVFGTVSYFVPMLLFVIIPIGFVYRAIGLFYIRSSRSLNRIGAVTRSPILSQFTETLNGVSIIRAFQQSERFELEFAHRVDDKNRASYFLAVSNLWLSLRIETVGGMVMFILGIMVIASGISPALAGLCLSLSLNLSDQLINMVRNQSRLEMVMNSVERCMEYLEIEQEAAAIVESNRPASNWPSEGCVSFRDLEMRYSASTPVVLHGISAEIGPREKVGIVGRTGAGKSTMTLALLRIIEPSAGTIVIDGVDIREIGLEDLRSHLTIIPQDPVLFAGTVRYNLDPLGTVPDAELWAALKRAHLVTPSVANDTVSSSSSLRGYHSAGPEDNGDSSGKVKDNEFIITLDTAIAEGGSNLSAGQRQLLCLARALARKSRVIMLDEATASVDTETDSRIQETIRTEFAHCTVLTIAHRLKTVVDYDRVIVLDQGKIVENGSPLELIEKSPVKVFRKMCEESGEFEELVAIAKRK
ncbi:hypothetical protein HDU76_011210 [Blyttiomyces sp. JEL0837]|nr:hypothetical protein HDU76_011210 [Blyttiomyces sp. JEL0837]